jgi:hypothetical protein
MWISSATTEWKKNKQLSRGGLECIENDSNKFLEDLKWVTCIAW